MKAVGVMLVFLCSSAAMSAKAGLSQNDAAKAVEELTIGCRYGRMMAPGGAVPVDTPQILVREVKRTPYPRLTVVKVAPGKIMAKLRVGPDGRFALAHLKDGEYYFEVATPGGKAVSMFRFAALSGKDDCTDELEVTDIDGNLAVTKRSS